MKVIAQSKDYNCGVYALHFLLGLYGIESSPDELERIMGTTDKDGTSHDAIKKGIKYFNLKYLSYANSHLSTLEEFLPAIINYQYCDEAGCDGHYSVVLGKADDFYTIYNPFNGEIERLDKKYLDKNWYSERYGKQWFIQIIDK